MNYPDFNDALKILSKALADKAILDKAVESREVETALSILEKNTDSKEYVSKFRNALPNGTFEELRAIYKDIDVSVSMSSYKQAGQGNS